MLHGSRCPEQFVAGEGLCGSLFGLLHGLFSRIDILRFCRAVSMHKLLFCATAGWLSNNAARDPQLLS